MKQSSGIISAPPFIPDSEELEDTGNDLEWRNVQVAASQHGMRLDRALAEGVPEFSRSYLQQLIDAGLVTMGGIAARKSSARVSAGDVLGIELRPTPQSQAFTPQVMPLDIVFEDAHLMVINKPAGLVVHPAPGNWSGTLLNGLLAYASDFSLVPRAGIVHRLDKDTSGLMVVARSRLAMDRLIQAIAARDVRREYVAIAQGRWSGLPRKTVELAIGRDPRNRLRMATVNLDSQSGKAARTDFELLGNTADGCFVQCTLHTGRTHQIRVHMASMGHPLVADTVYGASTSLGMHRQALHAFRLAFKHPITEEFLAFEAAPPVDFMGLLREWGLRYNPPTRVESP